jgi:hypothetical protein
MARGQTTMDFAIGMSLFLLVLVGVFTFLPSVFAPFSADGGSSMVVADRAAARLAGQTLVATTERPLLLDAACTVAFFDETSPVPADCNFDADAGNLGAALGVDTDVHRVNVTLEDDGGVVSLKGTPLRAGPDIPPSGDVVTATRAVRLDGTRERLLVRVW